jgi:hypothetical protein
LKILLGALLLVSMPAYAQPDWTSFVIHVRQGAVNGPVIGEACTTSTVGCARRTPSTDTTWLNGECWITVRDWDSSITRNNILINWGHELAHCIGKSHNDGGIWE